MAYFADKYARRPVARSICFQVHYEERLWNVDAVDKVAGDVSEGRGLFEETSPAILPNRIVTLPDGRNT